ncbi:MAG: phosphotransferase [Pseudomonadota bacterium]
MTTLFDQQREAAMVAFLTRIGLGAGDVSPLAGDASMRRYLRVAHGGAVSVLMDAPPGANERMDSFVAVTATLRSLGLSAPEVIAADLDAGFLLLEDLGDDLFARIMAAQPSDEAELYDAAVDLLAALPDAEPANPPAGVRPYDLPTYRREARLVIDWYVAGAASPLAEDAAAEFGALIDAAMTTLPNDAPVLVLRDYHAENLIWLPGRVGHARVGLLDYQDALVGHRAYDLVSLLEDARRDVDPALATQLFDRFGERCGLDAAGRQALQAAYDLLGAQRNLKILGIFARLALRDGKPRYLDLIPRVWRYLERDLQSPSCRALAGFVTRHIPPPTPEVLARLSTAAGVERPGNEHPGSGHPGGGDRRAAGR